MQHCRGLLRNWKSGNGGGDEFELGHVGVVPAIAAAVAGLLRRRRRRRRRPLVLLRGGSAAPALSFTFLPLGFSPIPNHCKSPRLAWVFPSEVVLA